MLQRYVVNAYRRLPSGTETRISKAIREETPMDALVEFCNILGLPIRLLDCPNMMGSDRWDLFVFNVTEPEFMACIDKYNLDPIPHDFRAGPTGVDS